MFKRSKWKKLSLYAASFATAAVLLTGCGGSDGAAGVAGTAGTNGTNGADGTNTVATVQVSTLSAEQWGALKPQIDPASISVTISSAPVVKFKVTDDKGMPVVGLTAKSQAASATVAGYGNIGFTLAKLVPGTPSLQPGAAGPSKWVSYLVTKPATTTSPAAGTYPTFDKEGTLVDNGDGTYQYTFYRDVTKVKDVIAALTDSGDFKKADLGDLTYDATLTHRLGIMIYGNQPGTGTNTSNAVQVTAAVPMINTLNAYLDFRPDGQPVTTSRTVVIKDSCSACHAGKGIGHANSPNSSTDGNYIGRNDPNFCVTCHTDQTKYGFPEVTTDSTGMVYTSAYKRVNGQSAFDYPRMIHQTHMGQDLTKTGYNLNGHYNATTGAYPAQAYNKVLYPQDIRNCTTCHDGSATATHKTPQGDNWKSVPSILACGSCHDGINFATGTGTTAGGATTGHVGGAQADDTKCALCHTPAAIPVYHTPVTPPDATVLATQKATGYTNAASIAANQDNLPAGASKITYDVNSVTVDSSRHAVVNFKILKDGVGVTFNTYSAGVTTELMNNFIGSPSVYVVFALPQDNILTPADYNASVSGYVKGLWNGTASGTGAGLLSGPDANGYYTATLTGAVIPTTATMVTAGVGYTYTLTSALPLTQTNVSGYAYNPATSIGGLIVAAPNVWKVGTGYTGRRLIVENARCNTCHMKLGVFTKEAFHAGQRNDSQSCAFCHNPNKTSGGWAADSSTFIHGIHGASKRSVPFGWQAALAYDKLIYPGTLKNCEQCHLPGTYDFSATASAAAANAGTLLYSTVGTGTYAASTSLPSDITVGQAYGAVYSVTAATGVVTEAAATTLVNSPIASACFSCHTTTTAKAHMQANGGSIYAPRSTALATQETCLVCHGPGRVAAIKDVHAN